MEASHNEHDAGPAVLIAIAAAIALYIPSVMAWAGAMQWIRPQQHADEAMGRGLEAMFIGGPLVTTVLAILAWWLVRRYGRKIGYSSAIGVLVAAVVGTAIVGRVVVF